jgi:hypothetical protein
MIAVKPVIDDRMVLAKATARAGKALGFKQDEIAEILGRDRSVFSRGIDPNDKVGELALLLVRAYRSLFVLVGDEGDGMRHWMRTENRHTGGVPAEQLQSVTGLVEVVSYLDAIRGKV